MRIAFCVGGDEDVSGRSHPNLEEPEEQWGKITGRRRGEGAEKKGCVAEKGRGCRNSRKHEQSAT